jgi:hypothetical protein
VRLASFLIAVAVATAACPAGPLGAAGLYTDLPSFFSPIDSARVLVVVRQSECDLGADRASLLAADLLIHPRPRYDVRAGLRFPAIRDPDGVRYGVGDLMLQATARVTGDSVGTSGVFLRAGARIPTGSDALSPFSDAAFEGEGGIELRFAVRSFAVRAAGLRSLATPDRSSAGFSNGGHFTIAASVSAGPPNLGSLGVYAMYVHFDTGDDRSVYAGTLGRELSPQLLLELSGAFEAGAAAARVFDSCLSVSLTYRFPPLPPAPRSATAEP